jgi:hypothetical protein
MQGPRLKYRQMPSDYSGLIVHCKVMKIGDGTGFHHCSALENHQNRDENHQKIGSFKQESGMIDD